MTSHSGAPKLVMVVDDDADARETIQLVLECSGYQVIAASDGVDALRQLAEIGTLPRVILLDLRMPVMGGEHFRREQRRNPKFADVPVVVMSGDTNVSARAKDMEIQHFVVKPVSLDVLLEIVGRHFAAPL